MYYSKFNQKLSPDLEDIIAATGSKGSGSDIDEATEKELLKDDKSS